MRCLSVFLMVSALACGGGEPEPAPEPDAPVAPEPTPDEPALPPAPMPPPTPDPRPISPPAPAPAPVPHLPPPPVSPPEPDGPAVEPAACAPAEEGRTNVCILADGPGSVTMIVLDVSSNVRHCSNSSCEFDIESGHEIELHGVPFIDGEFLGWGGDCSGSSECVLPLEGESVSVSGEFSE
jgi:hypothetical protein